MNQNEHWPLTTSSSEEVDLEPSFQDFILGIFPAACALIFEAIKLVKPQPEKAKRRDMPSLVST